MDGSLFGGSGGWVGVVGGGRGGVDVRGLEGFGYLEGEGVCHGGQQWTCVREERELVCDSGGWWWFIDWETGLHYGWGKLHHNTKVVIALFHLLVVKWIGA